MNRTITGIATATAITAAGLLAAVGTASADPVSQGQKDCPPKTLCLWADKDFQGSAEFVSEDRGWTSLVDGPILRAASSYWNNTGHEVAFGDGEGHQFTAEPGKSETDLQAVFGSWNDRIVDVFT